MSETTYRFLFKAAYALCLLWIVASMIFLWNDQSTVKNSESGTIRIISGDLSDIEIKLSPVLADVVVFGPVSAEWSEDPK